MNYRHLTDLYIGIKRERKKWSYRSLTLMRRLVTSTRLRVSWVWRCSSDPHAATTAAAASLGQALVNEGALTRSVGV